MGNLQDCDVLLFVHADQLRHRLRPVSAGDAIAAVLVDHMGGGQNFATLAYEYASSSFTPWVIALDVSARQAQVQPVGSFQHGIRLIAGDPFPVIAIADRK